MRANGQYALEETRDYISGQLSSAELWAEGPYVYDTSKVFTVYATGMVTILCDEALAVAAVVFPEASGRDPINFRFPDDGHPHRILFTCDSKADIHFASSYYPNRRIRVTAICTGSIYHFGAESFLSVDFADDNDLMGLEIPGRKVSVELINQTGFLDPLAEAALPTFQKDETNAILLFSYNGETIPIGRLFLTSYSVTRQAVKFIFSWAAQPLNTNKRKISYAEPASAYTRYDEITTTSPEYVMVELETQHQSFGGDLHIDHRVTADVETSTTPIISLPYPVSTDIECLQMLCNAAGWVLRPDREGDVFITNHQTAAVRRIGYEELFEDPVYGDTGKDGNVSFEYTQITGFKTVQQGDNVTLYNGEWKYFQLSEPTKTWTNKDTLILDSDGSRMGVIVFAAQGYALYAYAQFDRFVEPPENWSMTVQIPDLPDTIATQRILNPAYSSSDITIRNPIIDANIYQSWWLKLNKLLGRHVTVTLQHRGFPELDCGDKIAVQLDPDGEYQDGWVIENNWKFKSGVLSGSTKIVLPGGVG